MPVQQFDTVIVGLGAMGSSAAYHLAKKKKRVLGLEQYSCAHDKGSSHGESRLIRQAYFEHPDYVPLLKRSCELWAELESESHTSLFHRTGVLIFGPESGGKVLPGVRASGREYGIRLIEYSKADAEKKFPLLKVPKGFQGIFEPGAGFLEVENCVRTHCELATRHGADLHFNETVQSWKSNGQSVSVKTNAGEYEAQSLILTAGPWSAQVVGEFGMPLKVHRVPLFWFEANESFSEEKGFPCFAYDLPYGFIYGFPWRKDKGVKIAPHIPGSEVKDPAKEDRKTNPKELAPVLQCIRECLPSLKTSVMKEALCFYTMSPDSHFIIDLHPKFKNVSLACGFSGHGFKFSSVVGEILTDLALEQRTSQPISFLKIRHT